MDQKKKKRIEMICSRRNNKSREHLFPNLPKLSWTVDENGKGVTRFSSKAASGNWAEGYDPCYMPVSNP